MKTGIFSCTLAAILLASIATAQVAVTGLVTDTDGEPLIGVNILQEGTSHGVVSDLDGAYSIDVPADSRLVFSYTGMETVVESVGNRTSINVQMSASAELLGEVVVTALGFRENRDRIASTYSKIDGDRVVQAGESKVIDGLAGKTSGVRISGASGDPGAGANIQIRGQNTLTGSSQPLIIVDGVPYSNDYLRGDGSDEDAGVSQQSRLNDINPEDIETLQIYKGASAGALYGTRAMNGAIVITTKRGQAGKLKVGFTSTYTVDEIAYKHPLQQIYGQGTNGRFSPTTAFSWGDKIRERSGAADDVNRDGQHFRSTTGNVIYPITTKNSRETYTDRNFDRIFGNGSAWDNKLSFSGGNDQGTFYLSLGHLEQDGIIQGSFFDKTNVTLSTTRHFGEKFSASVKANYVNSTSNRIQQGSNTAGVYLGLLRSPPDFDITDYRGDYVSSSGTVVQSRQRSYRRYLGNNDNAIYNNPLWTISEQLSTADVNRFVGTAELTYRVDDHITFITRGGGDMYFDSRVYFFPYYTAGADRRYGLLIDESFHNQEYNLDFLANLQYPLFGETDANVVLGYGINRRQRRRNYASADNFISNFRGLLDPAELSKKENITSEVARTLRNNIRFYGTATIDYQDQVILTVGGAYEKHSSLNDGFFYPTAELGWIFTSAFAKPDWFNFGKLRLAYGQVGNVPLPHRSETIYEVGSFSTFSDNITLEDFGGGYQLDERIGNSNIKPEIKTEVEVGVDLRFYRNRINFSATYYQNDVKDALLDITLTPSLGYSEIYGNGADLENEGVEIEAGYQFLKTQKWRAGINLNYSKNDNLVTKIIGGGVVNLTPGSSVQSVAIEGHPIGVFYTQDALRNSDGGLVLDDNGFPQVDLTGNKVVGDPNPDWRGGLGFNVGYKGLDLRVLFETSQGNDFSERTRFITSYFGTHSDVANEITLSRDYVNYAGDVITAGTVVRGNLRDFGGGEVLLDESYYRTLHGFGDGKLNSFTVADGSWTRIREASLTYALPKQLIRTIGFEDLQLSVSGRNLVIWTDLVGIDPDINQFGVGLGQGIDYFTNPGTRTYAFSLRATF